MAVTEYTEIEEGLCNFGACMLETEQEWREIAIVVRPESPVQAWWKRAADAVGMVRAEHTMHCRTCQLKTQSRIFMPDINDL